VADLRVKIARRSKHVLASCGATAVALAGLLVTTSFAIGPVHKQAALGVRQGELTPPPPESLAPTTWLTVSSVRTHTVGDDEATVPAMRLYRVETGDTLDNVASRLGLHSTTLAWANPNVEAQPKPGSLLLVPSADGVVHSVQPGETPDTIARSYGVTIPDLLEFNGLRSSDQIQAGRRLLIPGSRPPAKSPLVGGGSITYRKSDYNHFPDGWCTWYVADRRNIPWKADAYGWFASAQGVGWPTGQTPRVGAVMVSWEGWGAGHVAYVERVNPDGSWLVSEMNYKVFGEVSFRTVVPGKIQLIGFVY
jgi:LysM repeat protein